MVTAVQAFADQPRQNAAWADLDKGARAFFVHILDLLDEAHRLGDLLGELAAHGRRIVGVGRGLGVGVDREGGFAELDVLEEIEEWHARIADQRGVKCGRYRQALERDFLAGQVLFNLVDGRGCPG